MWAEIERERLAAIEEWNREIASIRKDRGDSSPVTSANEALKNLDGVVSTAEAAVPSLNHIAPVVPLRP